MEGAACRPENRLNESRLQNFYAPELAQAFPPRLGSGTEMLLRDENWVANYDKSDPAGTITATLLARRAARSNEATTASTSNTSQ